MGFLPGTSFDWQIVVGVSACFHALELAKVGWWSLEATVWVWGRAATPADPYTPLYGDTTTISCVIIGC